MTCPHMPTQVMPTHAHTCLHNDMPTHASLVPRPSSLLRMHLTLINYDHMILANICTSCVREEMDLRLLLFVLVAVRVNQATNGSGLYIMLRNETTRYVAVWQIGDSGEANTDTFSSLTLGPCSVNVEIVSYSTMDTKRHIFVGEYTVIFCENSLTEC